MASVKTDNPQVKGKLSLDIEGLEGKLALDYLSLHSLMFYNGKYKSYVVLLFLLTIPV